MSALRLDPRVNQDRVYQYGEYQQLLARHRRQRKPSWWQKLLGVRIEKRSPAKAYRLLPYRLALSAGGTLMALSLAAYAVFSADATRLQYEKQELQSGISGLEQARTEALESNIGAQTEVMRGAGQESSKVVYPAQTKYVVLTNIPQAAGKRLVEDLYPLSKSVIQVQP